MIVQHSQSFKLIVAVIYGQIWFVESYTGVKTVAIPDTSTRGEEENNPTVLRGISFILHHLLHFCH